MFGSNKYKEYIEEPKLLNSSGKRIDFLKLKDYDFFDEINLLNSIFTTFNDSVTKGIDYKNIELSLKRIVLDFHKIYQVESGSYDELTIGGGDIHILSNLLTIRVVKKNLIIRINNISVIEEVFIGDLVKSSNNNNILEYNNNYYTSDEDIIIKNSTDIEIFFNNLKTELLNIALSGFQVGYSEIDKEYRKLINFEFDYINLDLNLAGFWDKDHEVSTFLRDLQKNKVLKGYDFNDEYVTLSSGLDINKSFIIKLKNGVVINLNTIGSLQETVKGIYFSFNEQSYEVLDFFEKLYEYRRNHIVEKTKGEVIDILDLLDVSPYNNRESNKNISRANIYIRSIIESKKKFSFNSDIKEGIMDIRMHQKNGYGLKDGPLHEASIFDIRKLKGNNNILDFIYQIEGTEFLNIDFDDFRVVEIKHKTGVPKFIRTDTFELFSFVEDKYSVFYKGEEIIDDKKYFEFLTICGSKGIEKKYYLDLQGLPHTLESIKNSSPNIDISIEEGDDIKGFLLENIDKFTRETLEDHGGNLENIPNSITLGDYKVSNQIIDSTLNLTLAEQEKIIDEFPERRSAHRHRDHYIEKLKLLDITTLTYLVLKHLDKIQANIDGREIRLRSSTVVPNIEGIYNGREEFHDVGGEIYEIVIGKESFNGKIDIDTGSANDLILGGDTSILGIFEKVYDVSTRTYNSGTIGTGPR